MKKICTECGATGEPRLHTKGNILLEAFLWLCFLIPGLIYSTWRHLSRAYVCRSCGSSDIIPLNSPRGKKLAAEFEE